MAGPLYDHPAADRHANSKDRLRAAMGVQVPFESVEVNGIQIAWREVQPGSLERPDPAAYAIVCLHDVASGSREYRPLAHRIPHGARLILIDWAGHGRSGIDRSRNGSQSGQVQTGGMSVAACALLLGVVLDELGIERPILLASGFGGAVAIHYAATNPSRVMGLVLCHPALLDSSKEARGNLTKLKSLATVQTLAQCRRKPALTSPREDDPASAREARRQALRTAVLQVSWADTIRETEFLLGQSRATLLSGLAQIVCPILFAVSRDSGRYPPKAYMGLLDQLLQSKAATSARYGMTEFVGGFHPIWDEPTRFAQALNGFVQSLLPVDRHTHAWLLSEVDWPARETILWRCVHPECGKEIIEAVGCNPNDE